MLRAPHPGAHSSPRRLTAALRLQLRLQPRTPTHSPVRSRQLGTSAGIVGLANVGKSALFNALTSSQQAQSSNFPFTTIEPNVATVPVPDHKLDSIARAAGSASTLRSTLEIHDIAGLIPGAAQGEGLGNQFLANIRSTSAIIHVVRCFADEQVIHVSGSGASPDPERDVQLIETELQLADLASVERRLERKGGAKLTPSERDVLQAAHGALASGTRAASVLAQLPAEQAAFLQHRAGLITTKPVLVVGNIQDAGLDAGFADPLAARLRDVSLEVYGSVPILLCAQLENEVAAMSVDGASPDEVAEFMAAYGVDEPVLPKLVRAVSGPGVLAQHVFYTAGPKESRAWEIPANATAQQAAGKIHSDIARGMIAAFVMDWKDFVTVQGSEAEARRRGLLRQEGRDYVLRSEGEVVRFAFNV